jgi:hypothetical protein
MSDLSSEGIVLTNFLKLVKRLSLIGVTKAKV